ncbi:hypothetical protein GCM10017687_37790 [Streptomyces echinatus]
MTRATGANTEPLAVPRPAAISRRQIVAMGTRAGSKDWTMARRAMIGGSPLRPHSEWIVGGGWDVAAGDGSGVVGRGASGGGGG